MKISNISKSSELEIMNLMNQIHYGWIDKENIKYDTFDESFEKNYFLQSPKEVIHNQIGVCWDQVELERFYFKGSHLQIKTFFIVYYDGDKCPTHTFLTYEKNGKFYWFEHSWEKFKGIHEYPTEKDLLRDVKQKFIDFDAILEPQNVVLYEYEKPKYHISVVDFFKHCEHGKKYHI